MCRPHYFYETAFNLAHKTDINDIPARNNNKVQKMNNNNKVVILVKGNYYQFFINVPMEECLKREQARIDGMSELEKMQESKFESKIIEVEFDDLFSMWVDAGRDINELVEIHLQSLG